MADPLGASSSGAGPGPDDFTENLGVQEVTAATSGAIGRGGNGSGSNKGHIGGIPSVSSSVPGPMTDLMEASSTTAGSLSDLTTPFTSSQGPQDYSPLSVACARELKNKDYEKRSGAAQEVAKYSIY